MQKIEYKPRFITLMELLSENQQSEPRETTCNLTAGPLQL